jgi:hypothetical protein
MTAGDEHRLSDIEFTLTCDNLDREDTPDCMTPRYFRNDILYLPDGIILEVSFPDRETIPIGACLRYLLMWYSHVVEERSGVLMTSWGRGQITHHDAETSLDFPGYGIETDNLTVTGP